MEIPRAVRRNGTMFLHVVLCNEQGEFEWRHLQREGMTVVKRLPLTEYLERQPKIFNLLDNEVCDSIFSLN